VAKQVTIPLKTTIIIPTFCTKKEKLLYNHNYIFKGLFNRAKDAIISHCNFVVVTNKTDKPITIHLKQRLGILIEYKEQGCYLIKEGVSLTTDTLDFVPKLKYQKLKQLMPIMGITKPIDVLKTLAYNSVHICAVDT
jgi:hypothetical protein